MSSSDIEGDTNSQYYSQDSSDSEEEKSNIPSVGEVSLTSREMYYYNYVNKYFKKLSNDKIKIMIDIINGESKISLRLLDWFVTRMAKKERVAYDLQNGYRFNVHISYKAQLKSYKKTYFDPFRRRKKFIYYLGTDKIKLVTTIGQLNFFKWAFTNEIDDYVDTNYESISKAMIVSNKEDKERKMKNKKKNLEKDKKEKDKKTIEPIKKKTTTKNKVHIPISFD